MRVVTGYYHASIWRYRSSVHTIKVIASERTDAAEAITKFLVDRGYKADTKEIYRALKQTRTLSVEKDTVIVAVTDIVITKV